MLRLADSRVIAPTLEARCVLARVVATIGRDFGLFAFRGADSHLPMGWRHAPRPWVAAW